MQYLPVDGDIISCPVNNFYDKSVTVIYFQGWSWKLAIDSDGPVSIAQPLHWGWLNLLQHSLSTEKYIQMQASYKKNIQGIKTYNKVMVVSFGVRIGEKKQAA